MHLEASVEIIDGGMTVQTTGDNAASASCEGPAEVGVWEVSAASVG
jgi:hypothetical protein